MSFVSCQDFSHCNVKCSEFCTQCKAGNRFGSCELLESGAVQHSCWTCRQKCQQVTSGVVFVHVWGCLHLTEGFSDPSLALTVLGAWDFWEESQWVLTLQKTPGSLNCSQLLGQDRGDESAPGTGIHSCRGFRCCQQTLLGRARSESVRAFPGPLVCKQTLLFNLEMGILHLGSRWSRIKPSWMLK